MEDQWPGKLIAVKANTELGRILTKMQNILGHQEEDDTVTIPIRFVMFIFSFEAMTA